MSTLKDAVRDPWSVWHLLLYLYGPGYEGRYAESGVVFNNQLWKGVVTFESLPMSSADPYTGQASVGSCTVMVTRHYDEPATGVVSDPIFKPWTITGFDDGQISAVVYRIADGMDWNEKQTLMMGKVLPPAIDEDGNVSIEILAAGQGEIAPVPNKNINRDLFPNLHGDDEGTGYPLYYGTFKRVECPVIDKRDTAGGRKAMVCGRKISSCSSAWIGDTSSTKTLSHPSDSDPDTPDTISVLTFDDALGDNQITASGVGIIDNGSGRYTGTANAIIRNPADQLHHLAHSVCGLPVDLASFREARQRFSSFPWALHIGPDDNYDFFKASAETCVWLRSATPVENGVVRWAFLDLDAAPVTLLDLDHDSLSEFSRSAPRLDVVKNEYLFKFAWAWRPKQKDMGFTKRIRWYWKQDSRLRESYNRYGLKHERLECRHTGDENAIRLSASLMAALRWKVRSEWEFSAGQRTHLLRLFDIVAITNQHLGWTAKRFAITGIEPGTKRNRFVVLEV